MKKDTYCPKTLQEAIQYFSDSEVCHQFMADLRWVDGLAVCPYCESKEVTYFTTNKTKGGTLRRLWQCRNKECKKQFSIKTGTVFEDSALGLEKWLPCVWLIISAKNGISSYEIHRGLGVTQKTAWFMLHRIRTALQQGSFVKMSGTVEADETFIGGKAKNMHKGKRKAAGRGTTGKAIVMGILERNETGKSRVKAKHISDTKRSSLHKEIAQTVAHGSNVFTDAFPAYENLDTRYIHAAVDHAKCYAIGAVHTNGLENFWCLLKRTIRGTYVSCNAEHLFRYLDEQAFRFNEREGTDATRFLLALKMIEGRRLTYNDLIGKQQIEAG